MRSAVVKACQDSHGIYGYRRVYAVCRRQGLTVGEKTIRAIMSEENLHPKSKRTLKYRSYKGETAHRPDNRCLVGDIDTVTANKTTVSARYRALATQRRDNNQPDLVHDFYADRPNEKFGTDITEFACLDAKVYFSPMIDFYDNMPVTYTVSTSPNTELVNSMLTQAKEALNIEHQPMIHSDRGWHYRHKDWVELLTDHTHNQGQCPTCQPGKACDKAWIIRPSLSRLGNSGDNARVEGFFGLIKRELYAADIRPEKLTAEEFIRYLEDYLDWFVHHRLTTASPDGKYTTLAQQRALVTAS